MLPCVSTTKGRRHKVTTFTGLHHLFKEPRSVRVRVRFRVSFRFRVRVRFIRVRVRFRFRVRVRARVRIRVLGLGLGLGLGLIRRSMRTTHQCSGFKVSYSEIETAFFNRW